MSGHLCDACGERPAQVRFTEIKDSQKTELSLCEQCARERGLGIQVSPGKVEFGVSDILAGMVEEAADAEETASLKCQGCGLTYAEFKQTGRLGCAACYVSFENQLRTLLRKIHGNCRHVGRAPAGASRMLDRHRELAERRAALQQAIEREDFEQAAKLRDECRLIEHQLGKAGRTGEGK